MKKVLVPVLLCAMLAACSTKRNAEHRVDYADYDRTEVVTVDQSRPTTSNMDALTDPNSPLSRRSVYFEFDSYVVQPTFNDLLDVHARYLAQNRDMRMMIQGNADERGSREYNLALGQKRAEAVKRALTMRGVSDNQLEAVSLGKEKPRCTERTESCYAENRRGDMLYSGEYSSSYGSGYSSDYNRGGYGNEYNREYDRGYNRGY